MAPDSNQRNDGRAGGDGPGDREGKERARREPLRDGGLAVEERAKTKRPAKYKVVLFNDDYTPMEFVVSVLENVFRKSPVEATQLMLQIHRGGQGIAGVFVLEIAETKVAQVHRLAEERGYPLRSGMEPE